MLVWPARNSSAVGLTLPWPARFGDDSPLATASLLDTLGLLLDEATGLLSSLTAIEEGVAVGRGVVGGLAQRRVGDDGDKI